MLHTSAVAWQGLHWDAETGHTYNRLRTLHHRLGRFTQRDRIGYAGGMNLYQYLGSAPTSGVDPLGLMDYLAEGKGGGSSGGMPGGGGGGGGSYGQNQKMQGSGSGGPKGPSQNAGTPPTGTR